MKRSLTLIFTLAIAFAAHAQKSITIAVKTTSYQTVTGFGAACCDGAMCPFGSDTQPVRLLYGPTSNVGLNIMRMEISPNFKGNITAADVGWDTPYDWYGSVPSAKIVKQRGGIVFGTPWSPPGEYKTNGTAQGGNANNQGNQRGELRADCYEKFFPWLNTFLKYMKSQSVKVDAVSIQNEPDWWVDYSGCLYTPQQQVNLVKNYAHMLDRETYPYVRLISAEPLGFDPKYSNALLNDPIAREQIDIIAGHLYGHPPLGNMKSASALATKYGKEVWMTEHSVSDNIQDRLPNWHEQLQFAQELNECMLSGCTGYIYWYMRAHWAFVGTGESKYGTANKKNVLLPRAYVMSHFSKYVTGATRLYASATGYSEPKTEDAFETSAYMKGDSIIVQAIAATNQSYKLRLYMPFNVKSCTHILSTGNEKENLCQESTVDMAEPAKYVTINIPGNSLSTFILMKDNEETVIRDLDAEALNAPPTYYDMQGRRISNPHGLYIEKRADGTTKKVYSENY